MSSSFEKQFQKACKAREIPGVVLLATDKSGNFTYAKTFGEKRPGEEMDLNATFILASCTKLMTSIAALQCVERGLINLDEDVSPILTELKDVKILSGFEQNGTPSLKPASNKITLRQLLTHTSGIGYDLMSPDLSKYRLWTGKQPGTRGLNRAERLNLPLAFEPGTSWMYGMSIDYAGVLVSRLSNLSLEEYMQKNIWDAVGVENITFHEELKQKVKTNLVQMTHRVGIDNPKYNLPADTGKPVDWSEEILYDAVPTGDEMGGQGAIGNPSDYLEILKSILKDDTKLLKPSTVKDMFTPQLSPATKEALQSFTDDDTWKGTFASQKAGTGVDWGLTGLLTDIDLETGRKKGTLTWSGMPNLLWTIDRNAGLACFYASNIVPFGDHASHRMQQLFEKEVYSRFTTAETSKL